MISRFRDNACLFYVYAGPRTGKRGRPKTKDGKIDMKNLDLTRMEKMEMKDIEGTAYTLIAYSKALRCKVRLVIWQMPNGKKKLFFSTDTSLSGEEVLLYYRTRFQIEFCFQCFVHITNVAKVTIKAFFILCFFDYPIFDIPSFTVEVDADLGYWLAA